MPLPVPLLRLNKAAYKNQFGHVLVLAGSRSMLGAAALTSLAAMRSGAGLVTVGVPEPLNAVMQKKISPVVMTLPLKSTAEQTLAFSAFSQIRKIENKFQVIALGPGLSRHPSTKRLIRKILSVLSCPIVIDADALNTLAQDLSILNDAPGLRILTPHPGEMSRLCRIKTSTVEESRKEISIGFARRYNCTVLLKGHRTVIAGPHGEWSINRTGNAGMATAGSGDVLTGMIAAFLAQGLTPFDSAKWGAYLHGKAGDLAAKKVTKCSLLATDIIDFIPISLTKSV